MKLNVSKIKQIKAILLEGGIGYDNWSQRNLNISNMEGDQYEFNQIFSINEQDVYEFIQQNNWNYFVDQYQMPKLVESIEKLPDPESSFAKWLLLPKTERGYHLATFGSWDRALWHEWYFETKEERDRFIIHRLFETQKSFWGKKPRF